jgi:hypothetical protein
MRPMTTLGCGIEMKLCKDGKAEEWLRVERQTYSAYELGGRRENIRATRGRR